MRYGSLFSGIGGFDLALDRAGFSCAWQVERDEQCRSILRRHWWEAPKHDDVRTVGRANLAPVDLICGGFPCQDLSVAGRRTGLAGERSGLFYELARIVGELAPAWILLENVPGLLSSNGGRDMGAVLGTLGELGYGYVYRVLDSQYLGVPQRRERVFIVGRAGGICPAEVLFESEGLPWDSPPSREKGTRVAASLTRGAESGGRGGYAGRRREDDSNIVGALSAQGVSASQSMNPSAIAPGLGVGKADGVAVQTDCGVRRLTPRECERLQALPDNWTQWGKDERGTVVNLKDSPRYRALGNAVTVSVVEWIARRIMAQNTP